MEITRRAASLGAIMTALAAAGCTQPAPPPPAPAPEPAPAPAPPPPPAPAADVTVGDDSNYKSVTLHSGQTLMLRLSGESPSTGYAWKLITGTGTHLTLTSHNFDSDAPPPAPGQPPLVGGGGTSVYLLTAKRPGVAVVRLALYPPGRDRKIVKSFRLRVVVRRA
jgi:predicted secreted protein